MQEWEVEPLANSNFGMPWSGIGGLAAISVSVAVCMVYVAFCHQRSRPIRYLTVGLLATLICIGFVAHWYANHAGVWLSLLFLAISIPAANMVAVGGLALYAIWRQRRRAQGNSKVEPYLGPVSQRPVDVVPDDDVMARRIPVRRREGGAGG